MARADLLALTEETLASLSNRGIVKRAARDLEAGKGPVIDDGAAGTTVGTFPDGVIVTLPAAATLEEATCSCRARDVCRHRVMLALAYRAQAGAAAVVGAVDDRAPGSAPAELEDPALAEGWTPGDFSDEEVEAHVGSRALAAARRIRRSGYRARVRRGTPGDPVPAVELASCTVRFLVPNQLGYARVDAARGAREDAVALAVWACRVADEADPDASVVEVEVGGDTSVASGRSGVEPLVSLVADVLADGVTGTGPAIATTIAQVRRSLELANLRWPVDVLDELGEQFDAYGKRASSYAPTTVARLAAEAIARHRCVAYGGASLRPQVLGTEESAETPLRLLRLTGLGARVTGDDRSRSVEVYVAHADAGMVLALRRRVEAEGDDELPSAAELSRRKAGGVRLSAIAGGNLVTESAVRSANRVVRVADSRVACTSASVSAGDWAHLPPGLLVVDLEAEAARLADRPPSLVQARVVAETVRAIAIESVEAVAYRPGMQELRATVRASVGEADLVLVHHAAAPGAIDAVARALGGELGPVRYVAGHLRRNAGRVEVEPTAIVAGGTVVVPAFVEATGPEHLAHASAAVDPVVATLRTAIEVSAEVVHRGQRHLPPSWHERCDRARRALSGVGLTGAAAAMGALAEVARTGGDRLADTWADTHLRLLVTAEQL